MEAQSSGAWSQRATETSTVLAAVRDVLAGDSRVELAIVFGSAVRGDARPDSDVDVAVIVQAGVDLAELSARIPARVGREADVVSLADPGVPRVAAILRDGVIVHQGRPGSGATWWAHALMDREVDAPWYARMRDAWLKRVGEEGLGRGRS